MKKSNIEIETDKDDFVMFKTTCECSFEHHTVGVIVEKESRAENAPVIASLYFQTMWCDHWGDSFFSRISRRIKTALKVLFTGQIELDDEFMFRDDGHLKDFRDTLEEAIKQVEQNKKDNI